jgi:hypothetical protein
MERKAMSFRLPKGMADDLAAVARAEGNSITEAVREALEHYIASRRSDRNFKALLKKRLEEDRELWERFADGSD